MPDNVPAAPPTRAEAFQAEAQAKEAWARAADARAAAESRDPLPAPRTEEDVADELYSSDDSLKKGGHALAIKSSMDSLQDATGMGPEDRDRTLLETVRFFHDARISPAEAGNLHSLFVHHVKEPATDEQMQQWLLESRKDLRERFGPDADKRLQAVTAFLKGHPTIAKALNESGLGSHPRMVLALAERTQNLRIRKPR